MFAKITEKFYERKFLVVVLLLFFAVAFFVAVNTFSEKTSSSIWDGTIATKFKRGNGTASNPYRISSGDELAYFFKLINSENSSEYFNNYYELQNNIDLDGREFNFSKLRSFSGVFNGNGYSLFNFKINDYYLSDEDLVANFSLFDSLNNATIKNLNLKDISFIVNGDALISNKEVKSTNSDEEEDVTTDTLENNTEGNKNDEKEDKEEVKEEPKKEEPSDEVIVIDKEDSEEKKEEVK